MKTTAIETFRKGITETRDLVSTKIIQPFKTTPFPNFDGVAVNLMMNDVPDYDAARFELRKSGLFAQAEELNDRMRKLISIRSDLLHVLDDDDVATALAFAEIFVKHVNDIIEIFTGPNAKTRKRKKHIPYKQAIEILTKLNAPRDRKTLQRWMEGIGTPEDFTPECMHSVQYFSAWATIFAHREQAKINTNNALRIDNPNNDKMRKFR